MKTREQQIADLKRELRINIEDAYQHEDDAEWYADKIRNLPDDATEEEIEELEEDQNDELVAAQQLWHVIQSDLEELGELTGLKHSSDEFLK